MEAKKKLSPEELAEHNANVELWREPNTVHHDNDERFGTVAEMIAEIKRLRSVASENTETIVWVPVGAGGPLTAKPVPVLTANELTPVDTAIFRCGSWFWIEGGGPVKPGFITHWCQPKGPSAPTGTDAPASPAGGE